MAVAIALQTGCLTHKTLDKWEGMPLELSQVRVEVVSAGNDRVVLGWETTYLGKRSGELEFDPLLPECEEVQVFMKFGNDGRQRALVDAAGDIHPRVLPGPCDVDILVQCLLGELLLEANIPGRPPVYTHIKTPRNHLWLALVPFAAAADVLVAFLSNPYDPLNVTRQQDSDSRAF